MSRRLKIGLGVVAILAAVTMGPLAVGALVGVSSDDGTVSRGLEFLHPLWHPIHRQAEITLYRRLPLHLSESTEHIWLPALDGFASVEGRVLATRAFTDHDVHLISGGLDGGLIGLRAPTTLGTKHGIVTGCSIEHLSAAANDYEIRCRLVSGGQVIFPGRAESIGCTPWSPARDFNRRMISLVLGDFAAPNATKVVSEEKVRDDV